MPDEISLTDDQKYRDRILQARERRWLCKLEMAAKCASPILSLVMNVPGMDKQISGVSEAFRDLQGTLQEELARRGWGKSIVAEKSLLFDADGPFTLLAIDQDAFMLKQLAVGLEQGHPIGRLADIDVYCPIHGPLSRTELGFAPRRCFLCQEAATICRRGHRHSEAEILQYVRQSLQGYCLQMRSG